VLDLVYGGFLEVLEGAAAGQIEPHTPL
jgi:hypothetical protein